MSRHKKKLPAEPVTTTIEKLSHDGRGIAHVEGKTVFIHGGLPGEKVSFKYTNRHGRFDEGVVVEVIQPAAERVEPQCPYYGLCGGCSLQHVDTDAQLRHKQQVLLDQLKHFGLVTPAEILSPLVGPVWGYRHKARLGVRFVVKKDRLLVGFRERSGGYIADINCCEVLEPRVGKKLLTIRDLVSLLEGYTDIPQIEVAVGDDKTALIIRHLKPLSEKDKNQIQIFAQVNGFDIYLQPSNLESVHKFWPEKTAARLSYRLPDEDVEMLFHPCDFTQINPMMNQKMMARVKELLELNQTDDLLDLFCGLGNFTVPLAKYCHAVVGIEVDPQMISRAKENAGHNHISNAQFFAADLTKDLPNESWAKQQYHKILLDPPRSGALEIIKQFPRFKTNRVVYVSCNPATFARDAGELVYKQGFQLLKVGVMDMFPHTSHVESIGLFVK